MAKKDKYALPMLTEIVQPGETVVCTCGSKAFFDWGIKIHIKGESDRIPEVKEIAIPHNVYVCVECHRPVVDYGGKYYDATDFIEPNQIDVLLKSGERVPAGVKDP